MEKKQPSQNNTRESSAIVITKDAKGIEIKNWFLLDRWWNTVSSFICSLIQILVVIVVGQHY